MVAAHDDDRAPLARLGGAEAIARALHDEHGDSDVVRMVMLADTATRLRDADAAASIRELLEPVSGRTAWNAFTALWPIDIALA